MAIQFYTGNYPTPLVHIVDYSNFDGGGAIIGDYGPKIEWKLRFDICS